MSDDLTTAGVAPQEPNQNETKSGNNFVSLDPEKDERVLAWEQVAKHVALKQCYDEERPLLPAVLDRLTNLFDLEQTVNELAPAPGALDPEKVAEVERAAAARARGEALIEVVQAHRNLHKTWLS